MSFEPAIAAIAGVAVLHEHLTPWQWLAIGLIIVASIGTVSGEH
jgi:inner membrane transporter RhtA